MFWENSYIFILIIPLAHQAYSKLFCLQPSTSSPDQVLGPLPTTLTESIPQVKFKDSNAVKLVSAPTPPLCQELHPSKQLLVLIMQRKSMIVVQLPLIIKNIYHY